MKKRLFAWIFAAVLTAGLLPFTAQDVLAADNEVVVGPYTLSKESQTPVEGVDYTYEGSIYGDVKKLVILTDGITIAMEPGEQPVDGVIELGLFNEPPLDTFRNVTLKNVKLKGTHDILLSHVEYANIILEGDNELIAIKNEEYEYGGNPVFGFGNVNIDKSSTGALYATGDGLGYGALYVSSGGYNNPDMKLTVGEGLTIYGSSILYTAPSEVKDKVRFERNRIKLEDADISAYTVVIGEFSHNHAWEYSITDENASQAVVEAKCTGTGECPYKASGIPMTVVKVKAAYDATPKEISLKADNWLAMGIRNISAAYYLEDGVTKTNSENSGADGEGLAPVNPGKYTVKLILGNEVTISNAVIITSGEEGSSEAEDNNPVIISGANGEWTKGDNSQLAFKSNADISTFVRAEVDGSMVDPDNYTVTEGSTIVTLKQTFLESLGTGKHTLAIVSSINGTEKAAVTEFTIKEKTGGNETTEEQDEEDYEEDDTDAAIGNDIKADTPNTGDTNTLGFWLVLMVLSLGCAVVAGRKNAGRV